MVLYVTLQYQILVNLLFQLILFIPFRHNVYTDRLTSIILSSLPKKIIVLSSRVCNFNIKIDHTQSYKFLFLMPIYILFVCIYKVLARISIDSYSTIFLRFRFFRFSFFLNEKILLTHLFDIHTHYTYTYFTFYRPIITNKKDKINEPFQLRREREITQKRERFSFQNIQVSESLKSRYEMYGGINFIKNGLV